MTKGIIEQEFEAERLIDSTQIEITDATSAQAATAAGKKLKEFAKKLAEKKAEALAPLKEEQKKITEAFRPLETKIDEAVRRLTLALKAYSDAERRNTIETQRALDKERADALLAGAAPATAVKSVVSLPPKTITTRRMKRLKILDAAKIPREFLVPDERKIFDALKAGKKVSGAVIEEYESAYI